MTSGECTACSAACSSLRQCRAQPGGLPPRGWPPPGGARTCCKLLQAVAIGCKPLQDVARCWSKLFQ
eukprot:6771127-Alexandrium_andersonii.AAC.1